MIGATELLTSKAYQTLLYQPIVEGAERVRRAYRGVTPEPAPRSMTLGERAISLIVGVLLLVPIVGTIIWVFLRTFGLIDRLTTPDIEILSPIYRSTGTEQQSNLSVEEQKYQLAMDLARRQKLFVNDKPVITVKEYEDEMNLLGINTDDINKSLNWTHQGFGATGMKLIPHLYGLVGLGNSEEPLAIYVSVNPNTKTVSFVGQTVQPLMNCNNGEQYARVRLFTTLPDMKRPDTYHCIAFPSKPTQPIPPHILDALILAGFYKIRS